MVDFCKSRLLCNSAILSSFYYGYIVTQIPGGWLAGRVGGKWVLGLGILWTSVLTAATPLAARAGLGWLVGLRVLEGLGEGVTFPAMQAMWGRWAPPMERSLLPALCYSGTNVGTVLAFATSGLLCASPWGWPSVFYVFGGLGCVWFVAWAALASSDPAGHPFISEAEKSYIQTELGKEETKQEEAVPWASIATSLPVWAIVVSHFGDNWGLYTFISELPTYLETVLGFDIGDDGLLSAAPYLARTLVIYAAAAAADAARARGVLRTISVRRWSDFTGKVCAGVLILAVSVMGCRRTATVAALVAAVGLSGLAQCGYAVNHLDIAPRHAGLLFGISNTFATLPGFLSPLLTGALTEGGGGLGAWRKVFYTSASVYVATAVFWAASVSADVQPWAQRSARNTDQGHEEQTQSIGMKPIGAHEKESDSGC